MLNHIEAWKLADNLTVYQISCLIYGLNPNDTEIDWEFLKDNHKFCTFYKILQLSVECGYIKAHIIRKSFDEGYVTISTEIDRDHIDYYPLIDWDKTTIYTYDLRLWFIEKNFKPDFFFSETEKTSDIKKPGSPFYAQKLHVAIDAWETVLDNEKYLRGKTPKQAIKKFIEDHASNYKSPKLISSKQAIEDIAKVANWQKDGGAPQSTYDVPERVLSPSNLITPDSPFYEWQFADELNVFDITKLLMGIDPSGHVDDQIDFYSNESIFSPIFKSIQYAVECGTIKATIRRRAYNKNKKVHPILEFAQVTGYNYHNEGLGDMNNFEYLTYLIRIDWDLTTIEIKDLKRWLHSKGQRPSIFFSLEDHIPEYCNPCHHSFSISLKAAHDAWKYTKDHKDLITNERKFTEVVQDYFRDHSDIYIHQGEPLSAKIIENITRVINWTQN